jgi:hypothetical protein
MIAAGGRPYRSTAKVRATRLERDREWVTPAGSTLKGSAGDWLLNDGTTQWTVSAEAFANTYEEVSPGTWHKTGTVWAQRLSSCADVETPEGIARAEVGDWLVGSPEAGAWPVSNDIFQHRYVAI